MKKITAFVLSLVLLVSFNAINVFAAGTLDNGATIGNSMVVIEDTSKLLSGNYKVTKVTPSSLSVSTANKTIYIDYKMPNLSGIATISASNGSTAQSTLSSSGKLYWSAKANVSYTVTFELTNTSGALQVFSYKCYAS